MTPARGARPLTRTTVTALSAHVFFELSAGVGMPLASIAGPAPAAAGWAGTTGLLWGTAGRPGPKADAVCAAANLAALAAVGAHLTAWPSRRTRLLLPMLTGCEGMGPRLMPAYNALLYVGGLSALGALARENRRASRLGPTARTAPRGRPRRGAAGRTSPVVRDRRAFPGDLEPQAAAWGGGRGARGGFSRRGGVAPAPGQPLYVRR